MTLEEWRKLYECDFTPWEEETNMKCAHCDCPHMNRDGATSSGYPKYKCGHCQHRTDSDPKRAESRRKIDYAIAHNLIHRY